MLILLQKIARSTKASKPSGSSKVLGPLKAAGSPKPTGTNERRSPLDDIFDLVAEQSAEANSSANSSTSNSIAEFSSMILKTSANSSKSVLESFGDSAINTISSITLNDMSAGDDVPEYESSFETQADGDENPPPAKRKRSSKVKREYKLVREFADAAEAKAFIKSQKGWSIATTNETVQGKKVLYRCNKNKLRGKQCEAAIHLLFAVESVVVYMYEAENLHTCDENPRAYNPIDENVKKFVVDLFAKGIRKRKNIQKELIEAKIKVPSKNQLNNLISELREKTFGTPKMTLGELEAILTQHTAIPDDDDEPFVVSHRIDYETTDFKFVISTKRLLRNVIGVNLVSADTTYKMVWQGFPVSPVGTMDMDKHFHLFATMVSQNERNGDFEFLFSTLKTAAANLFSHDFSPKILISDAADAIHIGFKKVFGDDVLILMCWFHMKKAVTKHLPSVVKNKDIQKNILDDIDKIHIARNKSQFDSSVILFLKKYESYKEFCEYFRDEWVIANPNWYEGASDEPVPSTNNAMESWNRICKDEKSNRIRLPLNTFFPKLLDWTKEWSAEYTSEVKTFVTKASIDLPMWTNAYRWARSKKVLKRHTDEATGQFYYVFLAGTSSGTPLSELPTEWKDFDDFKKINFSQWQTYLDEEWEKGICNCPAFSKNYMCKHVIGIAIRLKYVDAPVEAKAIPIEQKRKRGRPRKTKAALQRQD